MFDIKLLERLFETNTLNTFELDKHNLYIYLQKLWSYNQSVRKAIGFIHKKTLLRMIDDLDKESKLNPFLGLYIRLSYKEGRKEIIKDYHKVEHSNSIRELHPIQQERELVDSVLSQENLLTLLEDNSSRYINIKPWYLILEDLELDSFLINSPNEAWTGDTYTFVKGSFVSNLELNRDDGTSKIYFPEDKVKEVWIDNSSYTPQKNYPTWFKGNPPEWIKCPEDNIYIDS